jgi:hypothetical protein
MSECNTCAASITGKKLRCKSCKYYYHVACALGLADQQVDLRRYRTWKCDPCAVDPAMSLEANIDKVLAELAQIKQDNVEMRRMFNEMENRLTERINNNGERIEKCEAEVNTLKNLVGEQSAIIERQKTDYIELQSAIRVLEAKVSKADQYSRRKNVIISGLPQYDNENPASLVSRVANALQCNVEIETAHRLKHDDLGSPIIAVLKTKEQKLAMIIARGKRKKNFKVRHVFSACDDSVAEQSVYVNEQLGEMQRHLFHRVRINRHQLGFQSCFTKDGRVYFARENDPHKQLIATEDVLRNMLQTAGKTDLFQDRR